MRNMEERIIDGKTYQFGQFGAGESIKVLTRLSKILGPSLASMFSKEKNLLNADLKDINISDVVSGLCERFDEDIVLSTIKQFMKQVIYVSDDKSEMGGIVANIFDEHFQGRIGHMLKVVKVAMEVQYKDFFAGIVGLRNTVVDDK